MDLDRAMAEVELLQAAYPEEIKNVHFQPMPTCTLMLSQLNASNTPTDAYVTLEFPMGYPITAALTVASYRSNQSSNRRVMEQVVNVIKKVANEGWKEQEESGLACCAAAMEVWNNKDDVISSEITSETTSKPQRGQPLHLDTTNKHTNTHTNTTNTRSPQLPIPYHWISGMSITDRKSTFQAHVCQVHFESDIQPALQQLLDGNSRIQKAYHNMFAWRLSETVGTDTVVLKHDNDDDGEDCAGSRLAQLLHLRKEDGVLVVVSRWYGGIPLGPKRFAHITNTARDALLKSHELWGTST